MQTSLSTGASNLGHAVRPPAIASASRRGPVEAAYLALSSERTTAILVIALSVVAGLSIVIPQGREAMTLAVRPGATTIQRLAAWGLTDIFDSAWVRGLAVLLGANLLTVLFGARRARRRHEIPAPPAWAPFQATLAAARPECAVESLRDVFSRRFGAPEAERVDGSHVTMVFETSPRGRFAPLFVHFGLALLVAGAAWSSGPVADNHAIVRAVLEIKDSSTGTSGIFDMVSGEPVNLFRWPGRYELRDYAFSKDGLGPAVHIEHVIEQEKRSDDFWVYRDAPPTFDERHRRGEVSIRALRMGLVPMPGTGLTSSPAAVVMVAGIGLLAFGLFSSRHPEGLIWVEADGDVVRLTGVPRAREDRGFERDFERASGLAAWAVGDG